MPINPKQEAREARQANRQAQRANRPDRVRQTFQERLNSLQAPTPPTTQPLAASMGATPQEVAMTGTQAQVQATIAQRLEQAPLVDSTQAQQQELSRVDRLQPVQREATAEEAKAAEDLAGYARLGPWGLSIQGTINNALKALTNVQVGQISVQDSQVATVLGLNEIELEAAKLDAGSDYNKIRDVLSKYYSDQDVSDQAAMAAMDNLNIEGVSSLNIRQLIGLTQGLIAKNLGDTTATNILDKITMADLDLSALGFTQGAAEVAELVGLTEEEFSQLDIDQFVDLIEDKKQSEFNKVDGLKAQLSAAPPGSLQREILLKQLRDLGHVGITGVEAEFVEVAEDIDLGAYIQVGDEKIKVSEFLDDEALSDMVFQYLTEPDLIKKEDIISSEQFPELVNWIQHNQKAFAHLISTVEDTANIYKEANATWQGLNVLSLPDGDITMSSLAMEAMLPGWDPDKHVTSSELQDIQIQFGVSALGGVLNDKDNSTEDKIKVIDKINGLNSDQLDYVQTLTSDELFLASTASDVLLESTNGALGSFLNIDTDGGFIINEDDQANILEFEEVIEEIAIKQPTWLSNTAENENTLEAMQDLSASELKEMTADPTLYADLKLFADTKASLGNIKTTQDKIDTIFNTPGLTLEAINADYQKVKKWAKLGDIDSQNQLKEYQAIFGYHLDSITESTLDKIISNINDGITVTASDVIGGNFNKDSITGIAQDWKNKPVYGGPTGNHKTYAPQIEDGSVSAEDIFSVGEYSAQVAFGEWAQTQPGLELTLVAKDTTGNEVVFTEFADFNDNRNEVEFVEKSKEAVVNAGFESMTAFLEYGQSIINGDQNQGVSNITETALIELKSTIQALSDTARTQLQKDLYETVLEHVKSTLDIATRPMAGKASELVLDTVERDALGRPVNGGSSSNNSKGDNSVLGDIVHAATPSADPRFSIKNMKGALS